MPLWRRRKVQTFQIDPLNPSDRLFLLPEKQVDVAKAESELRGSTLRVYWYLFKKGESVGVREVQRALRMSSPSTSLHHLEKLRELGLLTKDERSQYRLTSEVKVGTLRLFTRLGRLVVPRYLFYATFFSTGLTLYLWKAGFGTSLDNMMAIVFGVSGAAISFYETTRLWMEKLL